MKLEKPFTNIQRCDFIVEYNHKQGKKIIETDEALYALENNEYIENNEVVVDEERWQKELKDMEKNYINSLTLPKSTIMLEVYRKTKKKPNEIELTDEEQIIFDCSNEFKRTESLLDKLGLTEEELDELFKNNQAPVENNVIPRI